jgi:AmiR/NasT family two-component response regulator
VVAAYAEQMASLTQQVEQLKAAVDTNRIVGAAIGIVMERLQLDRAAAFMYLVRRSQDANQKLSSVAQDLVLKVERNASGS